VAAGHSRPSALGAGEVAAAARVVAARVMAARVVAARLVAGWAEVWARAATPAAATVTAPKGASARE